MLITLSDGIALSRLLALYRQDEPKVGICFFEEPRSHYQRLNGNLYYVGFARTAEVGEGGLASLESSDDGGRSSAISPVGS